MILILSEIDDQHADYVESKLLQRGVEYFRFDPAQYPRAATITLSYSPAGQMTSILQANERKINLGELVAVWYRRPALPVAHAVISDAVTRQFVEQECSALVHDLWTTLDCQWLPAAPPAVRRAGSKALQLKLAGELGFELPPTLITNSPMELLAFYREYDGHLVSKLLGYSFQGTLNNTFVRYTEIVTTRDITHINDISYCPMILQAYVPKRVELRITVVGEQVFAAEIHSQTSNHTRVDWRRYDNFRTPYLPHALPRETNEACVKLTKRLGLCYSAIDMILTPSGRYVFLEINPNGQYLWIEDETGLPISDALCDLLIAGQLRPDDGRRMTGNVLEGVT